MTYRKKLIEVALPLEAINKASAKEKSIRHGHPSTLHLWWARRPLAACRAVIFASLVDDPSSWPEKFRTEEEQSRERQRIFDVIEKLVVWKNSNNEEVLNEARAEIARSLARNRNEEPPTKPKEVLDYIAKYAPPVLDPFCGGGSIPLEAQRLGLKAHASDLNPVAVLITKALIEIPPRFAGKPAVNPEARSRLGHSGNWTGATGLAEDVRYYGKWMRDEAEKRIGHLYPKVTLPKEQGGGEATVIAWLWARTVKCPNPACKLRSPLVRSFALSKKERKEAWIDAKVDQDRREVSFKVKSSMPPVGIEQGTRSSKKASFQCIGCKAPIQPDYIREIGKDGKMESQLMAIVAQGPKGRVYLNQDREHTVAANSASPKWQPDALLPDCPRYIAPPLYGMRSFADLFTPRQLMALTTFSDLVSEAREMVLADARKAGHPDDGKGIDDGGSGATAYADAVTTYLAFGVSRLANRASTVCIWNTIGEKVEQTFGRQAIPMTWDFAEANVLSDSTGSWPGSLEWIPKVLDLLPAIPPSTVLQLDATTAVNGVKNPIVITDPPYYDNIGYADLSDFFYVWLRRSVGKIYPTLFSTVLVPKAEELVATPYRFGGDMKKAERFFEEGLKEAFLRMREIHSDTVPLPVFYAFKQSETSENGENDFSDTLTHSTGWETMLEGLISSGFRITGTWPLRTERDQGLKTGTNVLASSIVLTCGPLQENAPMATRREFSAALKRELPGALKTFQQSNIAPVDLAQAAIGPGMAIFSRYLKVIEADGSRMTVRTALQIINQEHDAYFTEQEGDLDADTRFCLAWFEQHGMEEAPFGEADVLARAKNTSVQGIAEAGVLSSRAGIVRLLKRSEYRDDWDPRTDKRLTVWECTQHLIKRLKDGGVKAATELARILGAGRSEDARALAYRLYSICERKKWAQEALAYNGLVVAWPEIISLAGETGTKEVVQEDAFKDKR